MGCELQEQIHIAVELPVVAAVQGVVRVVGSSC